jgi:hypothetical protein
MNMSYFAFLLAMLHLSPDVQAPPAHAPGACLGAICLDSGSFTEQSFVRRYGSGAVVNGGLTHCYLLPTGLYFAISADDHTDTARGISWAFVGSHPWLGCSRSAPPRRAIPHIATPEGLQVGDRASRVRDLYLSRPGFLLRESATPPQFTIYGPDSSLLLTAVEVIDGLVASILVSAEE